MCQIRRHGRDGAVQGADSADTVVRRLPDDNCGSLQRRHAGDLLGFRQRRFLISDGVTGFKFPADSAEQLAQTLNRLQHAESVSEGALKTYQENFTAEANYRQLMAIYSKAMQKSGERNEPSCG